MSLRDCYQEITVHHSISRLVKVSQIHTLSFNVIRGGPRSRSLRAIEH